MNLKRNLMIGALVAICAIAEAHLMPPVNLTTGDESDATIIAAANSYLGVTDLTDLLRLDSLALPGAGSPFSVTYATTDGHATVSWDLTGTGLQLTGIYIFGGSNNNFYTVSTDELIASGTDQFIVTPLNHGGQTPGISHILFLGGKALPPPPPSVPDGGMTITLFGSALAGLGLIGRRLKK